MEQRRVTAVQRFSQAFPDLEVRAQGNDWKISFGHGATIYFRQSQDHPRTGDERYIARIQGYLKDRRPTNFAFPNSAALRAYLEEDVELDTIPSHYDFLIRPQHWERVIAILQDGQ